MLIQGDAARIPIADNSVHCIVTSPPYWGLRKYAGEQGRIWGGDSNCKHEWEIGKPANYRSNDSHPGALQSIATQNRNELTSNVCSKCGAYYGALGLEPTPELYIQHIVEICRELGRVLRPDGVLWMNMGDCYVSNPGDRMKVGGIEGKASQSKKEAGTSMSMNKHGTREGGNLLLMPHRVALALQADGWIVRQDNVWWKQNPMPESINGWRWERIKKKIGNRGRGGEDWRDNANDIPQQRHDIDGNFLQDAIWEYGDNYVFRKGSWRHTRAHEYIFMLVKQMGYYCNQEAVREEAIGNRWGGEVYIPPEETKMNNENVRGLNRERNMFASGRNPRDVLHIPTAPYKGAHYATYPPKLITPLIQASCPQRCCPVCGQAWAPMVENPKIPDSLRNRSDVTKMNFKPTQVGGGQIIQDWRDEHPRQIIGYRPTCDCGREDYIPGIVFDPFIGSGTTGQVARELGLRWVGLDISMEYIDKQAKVRTRAGNPSNQFDNLPLFEADDAT